MQVCPRKKWRSAEFYSLIASSTASIYRDLKSCWNPILDNFSIDKLSVEIYEKQIFSFDFHPICGHMFGFSFLITLNIYKDYFKDCQRLQQLRECRAKFCSCKLWPERELTLVHLSLEEAAVFVHRWVLWPRSFVIFIVWWTKEFCSQHLFQVCD